MRVQRAVDFCDELSYLLDQHASKAADCYLLQYLL
jgi:hypothetical protein